MEAKPEETASLKAENQSTEYTRGADSNSFTSCFVEIIQEKSNSCMEVENPIHVQEAHSDNSAIHFWQTQKLPSLKEEMRHMYNEGLPLYEIKPLGEEKAKELLKGIDQDIKSDNNKEILIKILAEKIENSRDNQSDLAKKCKEYVESLGLVSESLDESFYMDMICNYATLKSHLNIKINYLDHFTQHSNDYEVWEIKNVDYLKEIAETSQINVAKAMRKWKTKALTALDRFIKTIIKMKNGDDFKKVFEFRDKYEAAIASKKPVAVAVSDKKTPKANKRKHQSLEDSGDKEVKEAEKDTQMNTKKPKLTPAKLGTPAKKSADKLTVPKSPTNKDANSQESTGVEPKSESKKAPESAKKDKNTQSIMNFFKKKPLEQSETKPENKTVQVTQASRFKCLGSLEPRKWEADRSDAFEKVLKKEVAQQSIEELLEKAKDQQTLQTAVKSTRKIYINIHDSVKRIKGKYEMTSNKIRGRNPLAKDEVIIDYDIDSEDEIQEHNAENIDEEGRSENDESDLEEENEKDFIVPDGYISAEERPEDVSDSEDNDENKVKKTVNVSPVVQFKEDLDFKGKPKAFFFNMTDNYQAGKDMQLDDYLNKFKVIKLVDEEFPLKPKKAKPIIQAGGKTKLNPEAINDDDIMKALILSIHGEFSKQDVVININTTFPSCSKKSIEKKLVELENSELIKKDKVPGETKARWIVQKEYFLKFGTEEDYNRLLVEKRDKEIERQKLEKEKREAEKKLKQMTQMTQMSQVQTLEVLDAKKEIKENQEEEIKENSNDKVVIVKKTVQTELAFGSAKLTPNVGE